MNSMAYKLDLPSSWRVHPVFHFYFLNKVIGDKVPIQTIFPKLDEKGEVILEHEKIIEKRTKQLRNWAISKYLIQWKNLLIQYLTWEDDSYIQKHPQLANCLGQNLFEWEGHAKL